jgi:hypothetical protein
VGVIIAMAGRDQPDDRAFFQEYVKTFHERQQAMQALYDPRVEDLGPGDFVQVECACGHSELLTAAMLQTAGVASYRHVLDLKRHLRCRECDERGKVVVSVRWGAA